MGLKLWLDDVRQPPDNSWVWRDTFLDAERWLEDCKKHGTTIDIAQLDHDLGGTAFNHCFECQVGKNEEERMQLILHGCEHEKTGRHIVEWMEKNDFWPKQIVIHSWNFEGAERMASIAVKHTETWIQPFGVVERRKVECERS